MQSVPGAEEDRTARARIRDAAIALFAEHGMRAASMKRIAAEAGVSQALVSHHFGSKEGLRAACDDYVAAFMEQRKREILSQGPRIDVFGAMREQARGAPILRYLARMLVEGSPQSAALVDGLVAVAAAARQEGERSGVMRPVDHPDDVDAVLVLWSLGLLVLHEHSERLLGFSLDGAPESQMRYTRAAMEALSGLFTEEAYEHARSVFGSHERTKEGKDD